MKRHRFPSHRRRSRLAFTASPKLTDWATEASDKRVPTISLPSDYSNVSNPKNVPPLKANNAPYAGVARLSRLRSQGPGTFELNLQGATSHPVRLQETAHGNIRSLEHQLQQWEASLAERLEHLQQSRKRAVELEGQEDQPFEYVERLAILSQRQQELVRELDLSRNGRGTGESTAIGGAGDIPG